MAEPDETPSTTTMDLPPPVLGYRSAVDDEKPVTFGGVLLGLVSTFSAMLFGTIGIVLVLGAFFVWLPGASVVGGVLSLLVGGCFLLGTAAARRTARRAFRLRKSDRYH